MPGMRGGAVGLARAARDLHEQFRGVFGEETIQALLFSSYAELDVRYASRLVRMFTEICA